MSIKKYQISNHERTALANVDVISALLLIEKVCCGKMKALTDTEAGTFTLFFPFEDISEENLYLVALLYEYFDIYDINGKVSEEALEERFREIGLVPLEEARKMFEKTLGIKI